MIPSGRAIPPLGLMLALAACAPRAEPARPAPAAEAGAGIVVAIRPLAGAAGRGDAEARILHLVGASGRADARPAVEIIIRAEGGRTISVMQPDAGGLRPGDRVVLAGDGRTRIARSGPGG